MSEPLLLEMKNIHKRFPGVYALRGVSLSLRRGEVHALLGENGAGKSTLIKVLGGIYEKDEGEIIVEGKPWKLNNVEDARAAGVGAAGRGSSAASSGPSGSGGGAVGSRYSSSLVLTVAFLEWSGHGRSGRRARG